MSNPAKIFSYCHNVEEKRAELFKIGKQLKKEFVGIDNVIDNTVKLMEPWRIMPQAQNRPIIISLWGMTGTGKTSLVRRIAELLKSHLIQVDLGEFSDNKNFSIDFFDKYTDLSEQEAIILLDEVQNIRTLDGLSGKELERPALRGFWSLLSDGKIIPDKRISKDYYKEDIEDAMEVFARHKGILPAKKHRINLDTEQTKILKSSGLPVFDPKDEIGLDDDDEDEELDIPWHISEWTINNIVKLCGNKIKYSKYDIQDMLAKDFMATAELLLKYLDELDIQPQLDYRKCIIFIAGNLDDVYIGAYNANPDVTPDLLHENSKKITVPDVKSSLMRRFRPEQVARFGNNHIIYPAFNEQNFRDIIAMDLRRIHKNILEDYDVKLIYDPSVANLIYREGVFPTQGARPVLSTVSTLVEASIPSCLKEIIRQYQKNPLEGPINIKMSLDGETASAKFELMDLETELNNEKVFLSIEALRQPIYDDEHVITAVHEAGHTVCQLLEFGEIPTKICAFSPNVNSEGYMERDTKDYVTKEMIFSYITVALGGWAAEKCVFGEDKLALGSSNDIETASKEAAEAITSWGFGDLPIVIQRVSSEENSGIEYSQHTDNQIREMVQTCADKAEAHLLKHKKLLLDIASELLNVPHLVPNDVKEIMKRNDFKLPKQPVITKIFEDELKKASIKWDAKYE